MKIILNYLRILSESFRGILDNGNFIIQDFEINIYEKLKTINPKIEFSSDFIIAYPGEEKRDFEKGYVIIKLRCMSL